MCNVSNESGGQVVITLHHISLFRYCHEKAKADFGGRIPFLISKQGCILAIARQHMRNGHHV